MRSVVSLRCQLVVSLRCHCGVSFDTFLEIPTVSRSVLTLFAKPEKVVTSGVTCGVTSGA